MAKLTKAAQRLSKTDPDAARLFAKVAPDSSECWLWTGATSKHGYGYLSFRGKTWKAHRVSYTLFCGEIPDGLLVCHHCDTPSCVNPSHLFLGHNATNMKDMVRKGRGPNTISSLQDHFKLGRPPRGEEASGHKITEQDAIQILAEAAEGALTIDLAKRFRVNRTSVQRILRGETWGYLPRPPGLPRPASIFRRDLGRAALAEEEGRG